MGKPVRIHKKKSFMFTTKHHTFLGWLSVAIGIFCWAVGITLVVGAFHKGGSVPVENGAVGLFSVILNVIGIISGVVSINERDAFLAPPIAGMVLNGAMLLAWIVLIFIS